jgi:hypothetical protein
MQDLFWKTFTYNHFPSMEVRNAAGMLARARSDRNAQVRLSDAWLSTSTNRRGNAHGS